MRYMALCIVACLAAAGAAPQAVAEPDGQPASIADQIMSQILVRNCWTEHGDLPEARRLRAAFAVQFGRDGHFLKPPQLIEPKVAPANDPPMKAYIEIVRKSLEACNAKAFDIPKEYFSYNPPLVIELDFRP